MAICSCQTELDPELPAEIANRSAIACAWRAYEKALNQLIAEAAIKIG